MSIRPTLILGTEARIVVPVARSLARRGIPVFCAGLATGERRIRSRAITQVFSFHKLQANSAQLLDAFLGTLLREKIDYIMPCGDSTLRFLADHFDSISQFARPACPHPAVVNRVLDKSLTFEAARRCGVPVPRQVDCTSGLDVERVATELTFPIVVKPRTKLVESEFKVRYFNSQDELRIAAQGKLRFLNAHLAQEYCVGQGVGVELLMHGGEPRLIFQHRRLSEYPRSGGVSVVACAEKPDALLTDFAVRLLRQLEWNGVAMVEFRHNPLTGSAALMEVNGRFWGSIGLSAVCGFDFPYAQWAFDHDIAPDSRTEPPSGTRARWTAGVMLNLAEATRSPCVSLTKEIRASLRELSPSVRDMLFEFSDPLPAIQDLAIVLQQETRRFVIHVIRSMVPARFRPQLRLVRQHGLRLAILLYRRRRIQSTRPVKLPRSVKQVLFVCHGNIIRSAFAQKLFEKEVCTRSICVQSAGLFAKEGKSADSRAIEAARSLFEIDLSSHSASPLRAEHVAEADAIFVMDRQNEALLLERFPDVTQKVFMLAQFSTSQTCPDLEIPDPYAGSLEDVVACHRSLAACIRGLIDTLQNLDERSLEPRLARTDRTLTQRKDHGDGYETAQTALRDDSPASSERRQDR